MCQKKSNNILGGLISSKNIGNFRLSLRSAVRRYWRGGSKQDFIFDFSVAIDRGFNRAFRVGAASCGVKPNQITNEMDAALQDKINSQFSHIVSFADTIMTKGDKGKLSAAFNKLGIWVARYGEVENLGKVSACGKQRLKWVIGIAEHCRSCLRLNGIVKPASFWQSKGILPRVAGAEYLECHGYNCQCKLEPTDEPVTKGRFPSLP